MPAAAPTAQNRAKSGDHHCVFVFCLGKHVRVFVFSCFWLGAGSVFSCFRVFGYPSKTLPGADFLVGFGHLVTDVPYDPDR